MMIMNLTCKDSSSVLRPGPSSSKAGDNSSVLVHKLLQQLLISRISPPSANSRNSWDNDLINMKGPMMTHICYPG